jgi:ubiquinone/menaquinone biosynthesis C-methylase UbiE
MTMEQSKAEVREFWDRASCGEELFLKGDTEREAYENEARLRYELEPEILTLGRFDEAAGKRVLEIGVGLGSDHQRFAEAGADMVGIDLTERAITHTRKRLDLFGLSSRLMISDAEELCFPDNSFDIVYSWGVIHHSPDTPKAVREIERVLRPGGVARVMIYHTHSFVGYMLWLRYALLRGRPFTPLAEVYSKYLESSGTKAYTVEEARQLFASLRDVRIDTVLTHGDLLSSAAGQRHTGLFLSVAKRLFPRGLIRRFAPKRGLFMLIEARK